MFYFGSTGKADEVAGKFRKHFGIPGDSNRR